METGILPNEGSLQDQTDSFCEVFYPFVDRWKARTYAKVWGDVTDYVERVLKSLFGKKGK